jgi:uncharacterized protein (TIGR02117 family)
LVWLLLAGSTCGCVVSPPPAPPAADDATIAIIERGWHTDIGLPADRISGPLAALAQGSPGARFLVFGFGDRAFYMSREETIGQTLAALFPDPGVVLATGLRGTPAEAFGADNVVMLRLPRPAFDRVAGFVWQTLDADNDGTARRLADGPYPGSAFYASGRVYDAFDNCNGWTALALRQGGLPVDADLVLFSGQIMGQARRIAAAQENPPS